MSRKVAAEGMLEGAMSGDTAPSLSYRPRGLVLSFPPLHFWVFWVAIEVAATLIIDLGEQVEGCALSRAIGHPPAGLGVF